MECIGLITIRHGENVHKVPCGKCAFCLTNKRSSWMFRIHHEMRTQEYPGYFLTLTYHPKFVKRIPGVGLSLRFRDVQLFLKTLRKKKFYAKYICVGEYGADTHRPHYHMLIWTDCPPEKLETLWFRGQIHFGRLTMASAMYTLKYIIQPKQKAENGLEKTRAQFSKGLGLGYLTRSTYHYHTNDYDNPVLFSVIDGRKVSLPRYYRSKIFTKFQLQREQHKTKWESIRAYRKTMRSLLKQGIRNTKVYIKNHRLQEAQMIVKNTKHNLTL